MAVKVFNWQQAIANRYKTTLDTVTAEQDVALQQIAGSAAKEAEQIISRLPNEGVGSLVRRAQYIVQRDSLLTMSSTMWDDMGTEMADGMQASSMLAVNSSRDLLGVLTRAAGAGDAALMAESMRHTAINSFMNVRSRSLNSIPLSANVYRNKAFTMGKIDSIVNNGIALGQSAAEIAKNVSQYINPDTMGGVKYASMRLGRTELNNAFHTTARETYKQSPYVTGVMWNLSGSHSQPDECEDFAGEVFIPDELPDRPHPQCFCYMTPVTPSQDEFIRDMKSGEFSCGGV